MTVELLQTQKTNVSSVVEDGILLKHEVSAWASDTNTCTSCNQKTKLPEKSPFSLIKKEKASYSVRGCRILSFASICVSKNIQFFRRSFEQLVPTVALLETCINCDFCRHDNAKVILKKLLYGQTDLLLQRLLKH